MSAFAPVSKSSSSSKHEKESQVHQLQHQLKLQHFYQVRALKSRLVHYPKPAAMPNMLKDRSQMLSVSCHL